MEMLGGTTGAVSTITLNGVGFANYTTYSEAGLTVKQEQKVDKKTTPKVFFKFIKKNLKEEEILKIQKRLVLLRRRMEEAELIGQHGLSENCMRAMVLAARELKITAVLNLPVRKIEEAVIYKYIGRVVEDKKATNKTKVMYFEPLTKFPRAIPQDVTEQIRAANRAELFDGFKILYLDYTKEATAKSTQDKIREKDPVLFGFFKEHPGTLYFIADWVDEVCDLTFNQILDKMSDEVGVLEPYRVSELTKPSYIKRLQEKLEENQKAVQATSMSNWRSLEEIEKDKNKLKVKLAEFKKSLSEKWEKVKAYAKF